MILVTGIYATLVLTLTCNNCRSSPGTDSVPAGSVKAWWLGGSVVNSEQAQGGCMVHGNACPSVRLRRKAAKLFAHLPRLNNVCYGVELPWLDFVLLVVCVVAELHSATFTAGASNMSDEKRSARPDVSPLLLAAGVGAMGTWLWWRQR